MERNQYDDRDCLKMGMSGEAAFIELAKQKGFSVEKSTEIQDIYDHYDYVIKKNHPFKVEVKAMKRVSRNDASTQDDLTWIELEGVRDRGWLYDAESDLIAFEKADSFILVVRKKLIKFIESMVQDEKVKEPKDAVYKKYQRKGRHDIVTLMPTVDLEPLAYASWSKG